MSDDQRRPSGRIRDAGIGKLLGGDGVRGVAMMLVFASHVFLIADPAETNFLEYGGWAPILGHIDLGLAAFFALSGYLIGRPFARAYVLGTRRPQVRRFAANRILRVVPAFYVFATLILLRFGLDGTVGGAFQAPDGASGQSTWWQVLGIFGFVQAQTGGPAAAPIGQAWSLGAEMAFYALVPLGAFFAYRVGERMVWPRRRAYLGLAVVGAITAVSIWLRARDPYLFAWLTSPPAILCFFLPGVALALAEPLFAHRLRGDRDLAVRVAWGAFALAALIAVVYAASDYSAETTAIHHALGRRALLACACTGLLLLGLVALQLGTDRAPWLFADRRILWMGERSYSFYLVHVWVILEIGNLLGDGHAVATNVLVMGGVGLPVSMGIAALSYRYVERPFLERKRSTTARSGEPEPAVPAEPPPVHAVARV